MTATDLIAPAPSETSAVVAERVAEARRIQRERYFALGISTDTNAQAPASVIETVAAPDDTGVRFLRDAAESLALSARGYHRVLKLARTLADLDGLEQIGRIHLAEALSYRGHDLMRQAA